METYTHTVHLEPADEGGYEEALAMAEECIRGFLEALVKARQPIPKEAQQRRPVEALVHVAVPAFA